ncbi:MAG: hypothetical protein JW825_02735 [Candidatus Methanofastidiosa archaeon]|nr:hypothetical protein [Candidatus Methanofastidiosa archaeon]
MKELSEKQANAIDNIGFILDQENMNKLLNIILTRHPMIEISSIDGHCIRKEGGENGSFFLEGIEVGKLAGLYTETPERLLLKIAAKVEGPKRNRVLTWHFLIDDL